MPEPLSLAKSSLAYAKLVATPTDTAWSQVYNAGNLFACLELSLPDADPEVSLHAIGKDLFNALEAEFFTLEEKTLASISQAITTSLTDVPTNVHAHLSLAFFKDDILYLFIAGAGKVLMKRGEKIGVLLEKDDDGSTNLVTASGYLTNNDLVILQTHQFSTHITDDTLSSVLDLALPSDIAEALSPQLHEKEDGGQAAIIIAYHGPNQNPPQETTEIPDEPAALPEQTEPLDEIPETPYLEKLHETKEEEHELEETEEPVPPASHKRKLPKFSFSLPSLPKLPHMAIPALHLTHRRKIFLSIFIVLIVLLIASVFFVKAQEQEKVRHAQFTAAYDLAQKNYEEGKALKGLNDALSKEDLLKAKQAISDVLGKFPKGSLEEKQLSELLSKIEAELGDNSTADTSNSIQAQETRLGSKELLSIVKANPGGMAYGQNAENIYMLTDKGVVTIAKATGAKKTIIENNKDWSKGKGIVPYQGNVYVLDAEKGVLKFTAGADGFGKTSYFKGSVPDMSKATGMAIDGSVWIVLSDGDILKYTRGVSDNLKITGLSKPLSNPSGIFTTLDTKSVYVLDKGTNRVVKLSKEGAFQTAYTAAVFGQARTFEVLEKDKKIRVLANDTVWEIPL